MQKTFETPDPVALYVELGSGQLTLRTGPVTQTTVEIDGKDAEDVTVEQRGKHIAIVASSKKSPFSIGFFSSDELKIQVTMPDHSELATKVGSADLDVSGRLGRTKTKSGSGDVRIEEIDADALVETGSGDIEIGLVAGALRVKSGSGDVALGEAGGSTVISTGSGDVDLRTSVGAVHVKSGSGDLRVREARSSLAMTTASGDLVVGRFERGSLQVKNVSGDINVGIPAGIPVWTDISCVSGTISSSLDGAGEPEQGQDFIELRAKTVSGDIRLEQL